MPTQALRDLGSFGTDALAPSCASHHPQLLFLLDKPSDPVQVSFNGQTGRLERDLKGLTLPRAGWGGGGG